MNDDFYKYLYNLYLKEFVKWDKNNLKPYSLILLKKILQNYTTFLYNKKK